MEKSLVKVGLLGFGTVGTGVYRIIQAHQEDLWKQTGLHIEIHRIFVKDIHKTRDISTPTNMLTTNIDDILHSDEIDVIVEVMGGIEPTKSYILTALEQKKHVITANKDLMALHGGEILSTARANNCDVFYEASVAGGIPILRALVEGLSSDRINKMMGIVNGTTNYMLSKMSKEGMDYQEVLAEAQALGYAESDPTADVEGFDAARKMAILSTLGFRVAMKLEEVDVKGISSVTKEDIAYGKSLGYELKLLGIAERSDSKIEVSVQPTMIHKSHPLASVHDVFNAVYIYGDAVGETMFYGPGAGELPTATSVVSDLVTVVKNMKLGTNGLGVVAPYVEKQLKSDEEKYSKYFLRMIVADQRGVLAKVTQLFADHNISFKQIVQQPYNGGKQAEIILVTHTSAKADMDQVIEKMESIDMIYQLKSCYRLEGEGR
jgi:homoserine dehydrogenase